MSGYAEEAFRRNDREFGRHPFPAQTIWAKQLAAKVKEVLAGRRLIATFANRVSGSMVAIDEKTTCPDILPIACRLL